MSEQREALAEALAEALDYLTDMARGHDYADDRKISEARDTIEDALADAERRGADRADAVRDREFGNLRWMDGHLQGVKDGRAEVAAAVEAVLDEWKATIAHPARRPGYSGGAVLADLRAAVTTGAADRVRAEEGGDEPRCQYVSPSPWGLTQCALPEGHAERHAYSPSEGQ